MDSLIHYVVMLDEKPPAMDQLEGATVNESHGAVTPVKARAGRQDFACEVDMSKHAGKQYEGATHHGTGEPQFVNCPMCKETEAWKKDFAEHERFANADKGKYSGILNRKVSRSPGGAPRVMASAPEPKTVSAASLAEEVLPASDTVQASKSV